MVQLIILHENYENPTSASTGVGFWQNFFYKLLFTSYFVTWGDVKTLFSKNLSIKCKLDAAL